MRKNLWVLLGPKGGANAEFTWLSASALPGEVAKVAYPRWAKKQKIPNGAKGVLEHFLNNHRGRDFHKTDTFYKHLQKATMPAVDSDDSDPEEDEVPSPKKKQKRRKVASAKTGKESGVQVRLNS